jgi:aspartate aminotransferase/aromatic-amino-acid transaminase
MFETLSQAAPDKIFALVAEYRADPRAGKIDLGIGVYKDDDDNTPVMSAVRKAEQRVFEAESTKTYIGVTGNKGFCDAIVDLVFDDAVDRKRVRAAQAPGGTGSLWVLMQIINRARPKGCIWVSDPSWPNHWPMCEGSGLTPQSYPYFDPESGHVKFEEMLACLDGLGPDDTVLLHACCHNPTGANPTPEQWDRIADSLKRTGAFPLIDLAYLGFGDGLDADAYAVRRIAQAVPELMIAFSCSKNFGLYRERTGCAIAIARDEAAAGIINSQMVNVIRGSYSQPPDHGAEIVRLILTDPALRADWETELTRMRERMVRLRGLLADAIRERSNRTDFDFVAEHRGMFSLLGLTRAQVDHLKAADAIYMIDDSRINVAGIPADRVGELAEALLSVTR